MVAYSGFYEAMDLLHWAMRGVSIHNLCTVAPRYGELLALLVFLTWLLHVGPRFETCLVPLSFGKIYHSLQGTLQYVAAPLLVHARGSSCWWLFDRVWRALTTPPISICMIYHRSSLSYTRVMGSVSIHNLRTVATCYGELLALLVYLTWYSTGALPRQLKWPAKWTHFASLFCLLLPWQLPG